jgi:hypothetical protein
MGRGQPRTIVNDRGAHNCLPPSVRHEQPSYARHKVGECQLKYRQEIEVHGMLIRLLGHFRKREGVASVRQRSRRIRCSIHMPHVRLRKRRRHAGQLGCGRGQGEEDPEAKKRNRCQKGEKTPSHPWLLSPAQSLYPFCECPAHSCEVLFPHVTSASYSQPEPDANFVELRHGEVRRNRDSGSSTSANILPRR